MDFKCKPETVYYNNMTLSCSFCGNHLIVAISPQLAALSVGGLVSYPTVLLQQLKTDDTFELNLDTSSWIGSIHGLAGIPSILMPTFMQWKGRKLAFLASCIIVAIGWILAYTAKSVTTILISECFHGLGSYCVLIVSTCSLSELIEPKYRNSLMGSYFVLESLGVSLGVILGQYVHWKTISLIMLVPVVIAFLNVIVFWPESPSWLALKGRYEECTDNFKKLRGTDRKAKEELQELLSAHKEVKVTDPLYKKVLRRDFYIPAALMFVLLDMMYWSGVEVILIYNHEILIGRTTDDITAVSRGIIAINVSLFVCYNICTILVRRFDNKMVLLFSALGTIAATLFCSAVTYLQSSGVLGKSLLCLYGLIAYIILCGVGLPTIVFNIASEIIPVKHRDVGGALYIIYACILHVTSMKAAPYMFVYLELWGTFLVYAINATVCLIIVWIYVPETKNRTLQKLEDYFANGKFIKRIDDGCEEAFVRGN